MTNMQAIDKNLSKLETLYLCIQKEVGNLDKFLNITLRRDPTLFRWKEA